MTEINRSPSFDVAPPLLGSPNLDAFSAYLLMDKPPRLTIEESDQLGTAIFHGNLAVKRREEMGSALENKELQELEETIEAGMSARRIMASHHLALVVKLSHKYAYDRDKVYRREKRADMVGVGNLALMRCMDGYIHTPGRHFAAFAASSINNAMKGQLRADLRTHTGMSTKTQSILHDITLAYEEARKTNEDVDFLDVGESMGYSKERLESILNLSQVRIYSIDAESFHEELATFTPNFTPAENIAREFEAVEDRLMLTQVWEVAAELHRRQVISDSEWKVLFSRYIEGLTQAKTGESFDTKKDRPTVGHFEQSALEKIRNEIEMPGYYSKQPGADIRSIQTGADLLGVLDIPITKTTDILGIAANIIDAMSLTKLQREAIHVLMGTDGNHVRPFEYARMRGVTQRAVYQARENAVSRIVEIWETMKPDEKIQIVTGSFERNTALTADEILKRAQELKVRTRFSMKEASALAKEGLFFSPHRVEEVFGTWKAFLDAYRTLPK